MNDLTDHITEAVNATWAAFGTRWWNELDSEDAKQQAFLACWERKDRFDPERSSPVTFFSMVARQSITVMRQKQGKNLETVSLSVETVEDGPSAADSLPARDEDDVVAFRDELALVLQTMQTPDLLTESEKTTLEAMAEGIIPSDLAKIQGVSAQAVTKRARKGLSKLRSALSKGV